MKTALTPLKPRDVARDTADAYLSPVIEGTSGFGQRIKLHELLEDYVRRRVGRRLLSRWLNDDAAKRIHPALGMGLCLRKVFDDNKEKISLPWDAAKRRRPRGRTKTKRRKATKTK